MKNNIFFILIISFTFILIGQDPNLNQNLNFPITFLESEPILDGNILNETLWKEVPPITNLKQIRPDYNSPVSEKTEIRVAYTNKLLSDKLLSKSKVLEEINELIEAVEKDTNKIHEAADVFYHLIIYLEAHNIKIEDIEEELEKRKKSNE